MNLKNFKEITKVPLIKPDLPSLEEIADDLKQALSSGRITNFGPFLSDFEAKAAEYLGTEVVMTSSGTTGLVLALQGLGVRPGDEVAIPSFTFMATAQAVLYAGARPVFAEIGDDLTLDPGDLEDLLARHPRVSAVIPVHTFGLPCRADRIQLVVAEAASRHARPIRVLYDAAHAFGSSHGNRRVGTFGDAEVFSLSATKVLVSVEGGMISTSNAELAERLRGTRNYGIAAHYDSHWPGLNGKMSELHAIIGLYNLRRLEQRIAERQEKARFYLEQIKRLTTFQTLPWPPRVTHTFKDFSVLLPPKLMHRRQELIQSLAQSGIEARSYFYPPVHEQQLFRQFAVRPLARTEELARRVLTLPFFTTITEHEMDYVVNRLACWEREVS